MNLSPALQIRLESWAHAKLVRVTPLSGGCIAQSRQLEFATGLKAMLKLGGNPAMVQAEAAGLGDLSNAQALRIPQVLLAEADFLLLEWIESHPPQANYWHELGRGLALLHRQKAPQFGWRQNNFIGATPQLNQPTSPDWVEFYRKQRLGYQLQLAKKAGLASPELQSALAALGEKLPRLLATSKEEPCLIHGDLWSGNVMVGDQGEPVLIDPAVYYGHREAELAMTSLFGGFPTRFYQAYDQAYPLVSGWQERLGIYQLYHLLNHLNLFGGGYLSQTLRVLKGYL